MKTHHSITGLMVASGLLLLNACNSASSGEEIEVKFLVGSALKEFCNQAATQFNQQKPKLENGQAFYLTCEAKGSGDVVGKVVSLAEQLKAGTLPAEAPEFPTLISVDGDIYLTQLRYQINLIFPGQNYIPPVTDAPLLANSPMVFMVPSEVAVGLRKQENLYQALLNAKTHQDLDPNSPLLPIHFVQTAPTRSNSGLQTLVTQFASVANKSPEELTVENIQQYQSQVQQIQSKVTRYGISTNSLASDMVKNGSFWASIASVYESSVIAANTNKQTNLVQYEAIYPRSTFTSNMRAVLPKAPWVSADEQAAAEQIIEYLRSPKAQKIATEFGLRPGVPGVALGAKFSPQFGVDPNARYDSLRSPEPEVVEAMLKSWQQFAKKPSKVVIVVDSSGSMVGRKLSGVQNTLRYYIESLGAKERIALIDFDSEIRPPVVVDGTPEGRNQGMLFINNLKAEGGTKLYDATLSAQRWLQQNQQPDAINAVIILTDGEDSESKISLNRLQQELEKTGFNTDNRIAFFTIGYGNKGEFNPQVLQEIADLNSGYYRQGDPETISTLMADLQVEF
ncbi:extracellular solute-binding protein [Capilliphycus salinus ALCB114379]|uniref:extracellular solute-binding protein n=1 Tax=Capilliphycus salinus TaxID=2768948 RepID=UPI0039A63B57